MTRQLHCKHVKGRTPEHHLGIKLVYGGMAVDTEPEARCTAVAAQSQLRTIELDSELSAITNGRIDSEWAAMGDRTNTGATGTTMGPPTERL